MKIKLHKNVFMYKQPLINQSKITTLKSYVYFVNPVGITCEFPPSLPPPFTF